PVGRQLMRKLLEEHRTDRSWADETHIAAEHVDELRDLVELRGLQPLADARELALRAAHEFFPEVRSEPRLCIASKRPELQHREHPAASTDPGPPVEHRAATRGQHDQGDRDRKWQG